MPDVKWIKLTTDIFDDEKIIVIESMPEADALQNIFIRLICLAGKCNNAGRIYLSEKIPYTDEMLAKVFRRELNTVRLALSTFKQLGMIEWENGKELYLINFEKHQNIEGMERLKLQWREASQRYREKGRQLTLNDPTHMTSYDGHTTEKSREEENMYYSLILNNKTFKIPLKKITGNTEIKDGQLIINNQSIQTSLLIAQGKHPALSSVQKQHQEELTRLGIEWEGNGNGE
jgi:predicted phage replisome organizer